ncbi:MAG: hypothetical protein WD557_13285 [Dehalococcoidia bacterium]
MAEIGVGARVETVDGTEIGRVKDTTGTAFHVDAPRHFDYWLDNDIVKHATPTRVTLLLGDAELDAYKKDRPNDPDAFSTSLPEELTRTWWKAES